MEIGGVLFFGKEGAVEVDFDYRLPKRLFGLFIDSGSGKNGRVSLGGIRKSGFRERADFCIIRPEVSLGIDDDGMGFSVVLDGRIEFYQGVNAIRNRQGAECRGWRASKGFSGGGS